MVSRRQFVKAATSALLVPSAALSRTPRGYPLAAASLVSRAAGQNMRGVAVQGFQASALWSSVYRSRHYFNTPVVTIRAVIPTFWVTGNPLADVDLPNSYTWQIGLEYPFNLAYSGIPNRTPFTWSGSNTVTYGGPGTNPTGYLISDPLTISYTPGSLSSPNFFGLWTTTENAAGSSSPADTIPWQMDTSNNYQAGWQRYTGGQQNNNALTTSYISTGYALTSSSIGAANTIQQGVGQGFTPCFLIAQIPASYPSIYLMGDSIGYGSDEGDAGSTTYGDSLGSALGNAGYLSRWIWEKLGHNMSNACRGGDSFAQFSATNWKYRLQLLALANPTHILSENGVNDIGGGSTPTTILANAQASYSAWRAIYPSIPIIQVCVGPYANASSSDPVGPFASSPPTTYQTPISYAGGSTSHRGVWNDTYVRTNGSALGNNGFVDMNPVWEYNYVEGTPSTETSVWNVIGTANGLTFGGLHPNSYGCYLAAQSMTAYLNGSPVTDPF